ncbi:MAG: Ribonuclease 3, partial [Patescibacteria group bacterium]|nr:Ribonuclease 3 [Patescibacteria group bacterium]
MQKNIAQLEEKLEVKFKDINILKNALVHRSYLNEHKDFPIDQNER